MSRSHRPVCSDCLMPFMCTFLVQRLGSGLVGAAALALAVSLVPSPDPVFAAASAWIKITDSSIRLIATKLADGDLTAGVEIRLAPGWTTYWRNPGDAGVSPSFDWKGSKNVAHLHVLYPAPNTYDEAGGVAYGYRDEVIFPVAVMPADPAKPVVLKLKADYGVCKDLCIPAQASLTLDVAPDAPADPRVAFALQRSLKAVPQPVSAGKLPAIVKTEAKLDQPKPELVIDAAFPKDSTRADLYIDSRKAYVPPARPIGSRDGGRQRFVVSFSSKSDAAALKGKTLTLTLVDDDGARETRWTVK